MDKHHRGDEYVSLSPQSPHHISHFNIFENVVKISRFLVQIEGQVLFVETLLAEIEKLELSREIFPDYVLDVLVNGRLVDVPVDLGEDVHLI